MLSICGSVYDNSNFVEFVQSVLDQASHPDDIEFVMAEDEAGSESADKAFNQIRTLTRHLKVIRVTKEERVAHFTKCIDFYARESIFPNDRIEKFREQVEKYEDQTIAHLWFPPNRNYNKVIREASGDVVFHTPLDLRVHFDLSAAYLRFKERLALRNQFHVQAQMMLTERTDICQSAKKLFTKEAHLCVFFGLHAHNEVKHHGLRFCDRKLFDVLEETDPKFSNEAFGFDERWFILSHSDDDWNDRARSIGADTGGWEEAFGERLLCSMPDSMWVPEYLCGNRATIERDHQFLRKCVLGYLYLNGYRPWRPSGM